MGFNKIRKQGIKNTGNMVCQIEIGNKNLTGGKYFLPIS